MAKETKEKCNCMPWMGVLAAILSVVGLYAIILGIKTQWDSAVIFTNWTAMLYYLVGIVFMACAKMSKHHAYCKCEMHKM